MLRMTIALALFYELRGHLTNGQRWFARALAFDDAPSALRARALWGSAHVALYNYDYPTMLSHAPAALAMAEETGDTWATARALNTLGYAELWFDPAMARETLQRSIALGREIDDPWAVADGLKMLSVTWLTQHAAEPALPVLEDLRVAAKVIQSRFFLAWVHTGIATVIAVRGDLDGARREFELAIEHCRAVGDPSTGSIAVSWLAETEIVAGDYESAARRLDALNRKGADADEFDADEPSAIALAELALAQATRASRSNGSNRSPRPTRCS